MRACVKTPGMMNHAAVFKIIRDSPLVVVGLKRAEVQIVCNTVLDARIFFVWPWSLMRRMNNACRQLCHLWRGGPLRFPTITIGSMPRRDLVSR
jgi:hypothetical protein